MGISYVVRGGRVSDEVFARAWRQCESTVQLARRLGITRRAVDRRMRAMKAKGIDLPPQRVTP